MRCALFLMPLCTGLLMLGPTAAIGADLPGPVTAATGAVGATGVVARVLDGDTLVLRSGKTVRLIGIQAPKKPLDQPEFAAWPLAVEARDALRTLVLGKTVTLTFTGARADRHGRMLAQVHLSDGQWVQGEMLRRGTARVYSFRDNRALTAELLALEQAARADRRGIWSSDHYMVKHTEGLDAHIDSFQIVEGRVLATARVGTYTYLNFGADYRTDFTISVLGRDVRLFDAAGIDLLALAGRNVRVRGWLDKRNGPMIEISHPEQLEILPDQSEILR